MPYYPIAPIGGEPIGLTEYDGGTDFGFSSTSLQEVQYPPGIDVTVGFVVPPNGAVLAVINAVTVGPAAGEACVVGLLDGAAVVVDKLTMAVGTDAMRGTAQAHITGLTPGTATTWILAARRTGGAGSAWIYTSGDNGPIVATIWAVPS